MRPIYHVHRSVTAVSEAEALAIVAQWAQQPDAADLYVDAMREFRAQRLEGYDHQDTDLTVDVNRLDGEFTVVTEAFPPGTHIVTCQELLDLPAWWDDSNDILTAREARTVVFAALADSDFPFQARDGTYSYKPGEVFDVRNAEGVALSLVALWRDGTVKKEVFQIEDCRQEGIEDALSDPDNKRRLLKCLSRRAANDRRDLRQEQPQTEHASVDAPRRPRP